MELSRGPMRRNHPAGSVDWLQSSTDSEHDQNLLVRHAEHTEPFAGFEQAQSELVSIETHRAGEIVRVKAGFKDAVNVWGGYDHLSRRVIRDSVRSLSRPLPRLQRQDTDFD